MHREEILHEIRRLASEADGVAPGVRKFEVQTGYRWRVGTYWARWSDAVHEAGLEPNERRQAHSEELLLDSLARLTVELGRFPTLSDLKLRRNQDATFPSPDSIQRRFRPWQRMVRQLADYTKDRREYAIAHEACLAKLAKYPADAPDQLKNRASEQAASEYVYLMKSGRHYKIGRSNSTGRREYELAIQLPESVELIHRIRTDDGVGIEAYWHSRFSDRRLNGEWFALTTEDVRIFKRRKFM